MGNYKFRFSDMMPNAWFYKLKDMGKPRNQNHHGNSQTRKKKQQPNLTLQESKPKQQQHPHQCHPRKSYYITRELTSCGDRVYASPAKTPETIFPDPPRKSAKQRLRRRRRRGGASSSSLYSPKLLVTSSVSAGCSCRATLESVWTKSDSPLPEPEYSPSSSSSSPFYTSPELVPESEFRCDRILATQLTTTTFDGMVSWSAAAACGNDNDNDFDDDFDAADVVIDVDKASLCRKPDFPNGFDSLSEFELPPIITKPPAKKFNDMVREVKKKEKPGRHRRSSTAGFEEEEEEEGRKSSSLSVKVVKEDRASMKEQRNYSPSVRRFALNSSHGVKLRINSPRIGGKKVLQGSRRSVSSSSSCRRRSLSDSFAVVKSSFDPQKDFRESMVEMIVENNIRASKDLEDLLACYLSLNSDEYHDLIIKVFKQIWFDLTDISSK